MSALFSLVLQPALGILILALVVSKTRSYLIRRSWVRSYGCKEPPNYPHRDPVLGLDLLNVYTKAFASGSFLSTHKNHFETYGKTFKSKMFGSTIIKTADPEISKAVSATQFDKFGLQPLRLHISPNFFGNGIIVVDGQAWSHNRALIRSSFDVVHLANFERLQRHTSRFMTHLPSDGSTVDLQPLFKRLILDTLSEFIFGESINSLSAPECYADFLAAFANAQRGAGIRTVLGPLYFLHWDRKWYADCKVVTDFAEKHVDAALDRRANPEKIKTLDDGKGPRLRLVDEMAKDTQDRYTLRSNLVNVFSPAHDGAATLLTNLFFHLARNADIYARLRREVMADIDKPLDYTLLCNFKLLENCFKETHRLTTIATVNQRVCLETTVLPVGGGPDGKSPLLVEKGDVVEINYRVIHLDKGYWGADADKFNPDRWVKMRPTWEFTPFGGGPRTCPGLRLVYTESAYVATMIIREFLRLERRDEELEWKEHMRMTAESKNGAKVGLIKG